MPAKIQLSAEELELVTNTQWIVTKHNVIKKVYDLLGNLNSLFKTEAEPYGYLLGSSKDQNGKISKGENYRQLPYVILDYPSFFNKENILAIRTMFWWGNFFSITLHASGMCKEKFARNNSELFSFLQKNDFFICVNEDEWQHHFEDDNYKAATTMTLAEFESLHQKPFFKASKKISLSEWENANGFLLNGFREILQLLQLSYPAGKTDLLPGSPKAGSGL